MHVARVSRSRRSDVSGKYCRHRPDCVGPAGNWRKRGVHQRVPAWGAGTSTPIRMMVAVGTISSRSSLDHSGCLRDWRRPRHVWPRGQPQSTPHRALADEPRRSAERSMRGGRYLPSPCQPSEQNMRNKCNGCFGRWLLLAATGAARAFNTSGHIPIPRVGAAGDPSSSPYCGLARCLRWDRL